jgi:acetylornithine/succinyldiaminopimelate/putrescine aminotransferase
MNVTTKPAAGERAVISAPSLAGNATTKPDLISVEAAKTMTLMRMAELHKAHLNPGQQGLMKLLGFHRVKLDRAEGMFCHDHSARRILDFSGGLGSVGLGHNHPRILAARQKFQEEKRPEIAPSFMSQYATALALNIARCSPAPLDTVFLCSSATEAVEAALKLCERAAGAKRPRIAHARNAFHGRTRGALAVTDGPFHRAEFALPDNTVAVPFGYIDAIASAFAADPGIGAIILETVQGCGGVVAAPAEFWVKLRALCDRHKVLWIADEVECGFGRTGRFHAFEAFGVTPDVVVLAGSLGGGKASIGAMLTSRALQDRAYGTARSAMIHAMAPTDASGEVCVTAIEALNVLYDEGLIDNAASTGAYLIERLRQLQAIYPKIIKDVRGAGLMVGLEFQDFSQTLPMMLRPMVAVLDERLKGSLSGFVGALLLRDYDVLVAFTEYNRNVIRLEPPLICGPQHVDMLIDALDALLSRGIVAIVKDYVKNQLA